MVDLTSTQAQAKEFTPPSRRGEAPVETAVPKSLSRSPSLTADGVNWMYHQLAEMHTIATAHLAECARWRWT
jgi:hypothetical protein